MRLSVKRNLRPHKSTTLQLQCGMQNRILLFQFSTLLGIVIAMSYLLCGERQMLTGVRSIHSVVVANSEISFNHPDYPASLAADRTLTIADTRSTAATANNNNNLKATDDDSDARVRIAWLASFPNSGTSYTLRLVQSVTRTLTANNYGIETDANRNGGQPEPIRPDANSTGPFWAYLNDTARSNGIREKPAVLALTKTHCGGRCVNCYPRFYLQSVASFRSSCFTTNRPVKNPTDELPFASSQYSETEVSKVLHLIRDPVDNIVSRYHNWRFNHNQDGPGTRDEFRGWCAKLREKLHHDELKLEVWKDLQEFHEVVPCASDFFRYVQWHNLLFHTVHDQQWQSKVIFFEDYGTHFNQTLDSILDFVQYRRSSDGVALPYKAGKRYQNHFTERELKAIQKGIRAMSSKTTWRHIRRYFPGKHNQMEQ